jgi:hypothetical protein
MKFEDVDELFKKMNRYHPNMFCKITGVQFSHELEKLKEYWDDLDIYQQYYEIMRLNALISDIHTRILFNSIGQGRLPFSARKFKEGIFIANLDKNYLDEKLLYSQVTKINDIPIEEIFMLAKKILPCESPKTAFADFAEWINNLTFLKILGISKNNEPEFTFKKDCEEIKIKLKVKSPRRWMNAAVKPEKNYDYEVTPNYVYVDINSFRKIRNDITLTKIYVEVFKALDEGKPIIFDVRQNHGGNEQLFIPLCQIIKQEHGKGFCIVDNVSASASVDVAERLRETNFTLVGQTMAQSPTFFANARLIETRSGLQCKVSEVLVEPNKPDNYSKVFSRATKLYQEALSPDVFIDESIEDLKNGNDPCLNYCIEEAKKMKKHEFKFEETEFVK